MDEFEKLHDLNNDGIADFLQKAQDGSKNERKSDFWGDVAKAVPVRTKPPR